MRLFTSLKLGSYKPFALALLMLVSTIYTAIFLPYVPVAKAAPTASECYAYNNRPQPGTDRISLLDPVNIKKTDCINAGYCLKGTSTSGMNCSEEVYKASDQYKAAQAAADNETILNAQVSPVVVVICGQPSTNTQADAAYADCYAKTKARYVVCANGAEEGSPTEAEITSAIASCVRDWAKTTYPSKKIDINTLTTAVASGRGAGNDQATDIGAAQTKEECDAIASQGYIWADGKCIPPQAVLCSGGALGWILCPLAELAVNITSLFAGLISGFMTFSPLLASDQGDAIKDVWQLIVNIANVLLVIAFLIVVFSQATSVGLSNYGIKKMLPKIIAAAILMNLSFFICALGVDVANVLGQSVGGIIQVGIDAVDKIPGGGTQAGPTDNQNAFVATLGVIGLAGLAQTGNLPLVLPILASAAVAIMTAFAVIVFRQVAIVIMIIISPLAFVAWVLPNTESWFEKWRKFFIALLAMFPIIMGIFYGSAFMSRIILVTLDTTKDGLTQATVGAMALAVLVVPLFAMPFVMKMAGGILERFGLWTNDRQKGLIDRARNKGNELRDRSYHQRMKKETKSERDRDRIRDFSHRMTADTVGGKIRRGLYGGVAITPKQREARQEAYAGIYDEAREDIGKTTERKRGRLTDAGTFTASSAYGLRNKTTGAMEAVDKDKWMYEMYTDKDAEGSVTSLDGKTSQFKATDGSFNSAIASQAAKSGDKAMYGKLLDRAIEMRKSSDPAVRKQGEELEFKLRDFGVNNAGVVSGGHPDVVKGAYSGFKSVNAEAVLGMDGSAVRRMGDYLSSGDNVFEDLKVGTMAEIRTSWQKSGRSFTEQELENEAADKLGRTQNKDSNGNFVYRDDSTIGKYLHTARNAFAEAVVQLNTKDIYAGKAVEGGDLDKAVRDAGAKIGINKAKVITKTGGVREVIYADGPIHFGPQGIKVSAPVQADPQGNIQVIPQSVATGTAQNAAAPTINLSIPTPSGGNYPLPAHQVQAQVQQQGGWGNLPPEQVMDIYNHANKLPASTDSTQLGSEALDELRNRNILPPGPGTP